MITKEIVTATIEALEDLVDATIEAKPDSVTIERMGEIQTVINFWRMYKDFAPKGGEQ